MIGVDAWLSRSQGLIADLDDAGLPTGLGEQLKILRLLQLLEERGGAPETPDELARWVAPVMCTRSDQLEPLRRVLASHFVARRGVSRIERAVTAVAVNEKPRSRLAWMFAGAAIAIVAAAAYYLALNFNWVQNSAAPEPIDTPARDLPPTALIHSGVAASVLTLVVLYLVWRRINLAVHHGRVTGDGVPKQVRLDEPEQDKDNPLLLRAARMLNRPQLRPTGKLDVQGTVRATAEAGGRFSPAELIQRVPAVWMLLVERGGAQDPTPEFGARLSKLLARSGVRHTLYEFRRSPEWVRRKGARDGPRGLHMRLERALASDRPTRVLMLAEAAIVVDERTGGPARWLNDNDVPSPVLLTPNAVDNWGAKESSAAQAGVLVLPADPGGLTNLARRMQADDLEPGPLAPTKEAQFDQWQAERFTWLSQVAPLPTERTKLVESLQALLGTKSKEFRLLVGVAAFPEVRLDLMATLDRRLHPGDPAGVQRFRLLTLGRLVWLKESIIPGWLREDLLRVLPPGEMRKVREAWMDLLAERPAPGKPGSTLAIHLAEGTAQDGAQGDGLFLGFMRGQYDLPAPLRWGGLAALWRMPDRTELTVAGSGIVAAIASFLGEIDIVARLELVLRDWIQFMRDLQDALPSTFVQQFCFLLAFAAMGGAIYRFLRVLQNKPEIPKFVRLLRYLQLPRPVEAIFSGALIAAAGWLSIDVRLDYQLPAAALCFAAPLTAGIAVAVLHLWLGQPAKPSTAELHALVQRGRGTGLSDHASMLALLWLLSAGVLLGLMTAGLSEQWAGLASGWLIAIAVLGLLRATAVWWSDAQLQQSLPAPPGIARDAAIGLMLGQLSGAAFAWMLLENNTFNFEEQARNFIHWHVGCGLMLFGAAIGISAALWRHGLVKDATIFWAGAAALAGSAIQITLLALLGTVSSSLTHAFGVLPVTLFGLLATISFWRPALQARAVAMASMVLCLPAAYFLSDAFWGGRIAPAWLGALPLVAALTATWPLVQRLVTEEPPVTSEPADWRPRSAHPWLWVVAPFVLLTAVWLSTGAIALDSPSLVFPLAIVLAWRFGLRGYRTVLLMILPALWLYVPLLLSWAKFAPLQVMLPGPSQYAVPPWLAPLTLDAAASALLIAALFARPGLFSKIRAASRLPWWAICVLVVALGVRAQVPDAVPSGRASPIAAGQDDFRTERFSQRAIVSTVTTGQSNFAAPSIQFKRDEKPGKPPDHGPVAQSPIQQPASNPVGIMNTDEEALRPASSFGFRVTLGWSPNCLVVLTLFLLAITRIRFLAAFIVGIYGAIFIESLALTAFGLKSEIVHALPGLSALGALVAYAVGRYFERISIAAADHARNMPLGLPDLGVVIILTMAISCAIASGFALPAGLADSLARYSGLLWELPDIRATLFALSMLSAWVLGVRAGGSFGWIIAGSAGLALAGLAGLSPLLLRLLSFAQPSATMHASLAPFLPLALFVVGTLCRDAVARPASEAAAPKEKWLRDLESLGLRFAPIYARAQQVAARIWQPAERPDPKEPISVEQPAAAEVESTTESPGTDGNADRPHLQSASEQEPVKGPGAPREHKDWSFTFAASNYPRYPDAASALPDAERGAAEFNNWVTSASWGGVPAKQALIFTGREASGAALKRGLYEILQQAAKSKIGGAPRRLYLYFAGYVFGDRELGLATTDSEPGDDFHSVVNLKNLIEDVRASGPFTEVVLFLDGRMPIGSRLSSGGERSSAELNSDVVFYSITFIDRGPLSTVDEPGAFARALMEGLRGAAADSSGRITSQTLGSYVTKQVSASELAPEVRFHGSRSPIVIAEIASA
jgi:hypothetical protein